MSDSEPTKAGINPPVFFPSVAVIGVLVVFGAVFPEKADAGMELYLADYEANQQMSEIEVFRDELKENVMNAQ